MTQSSVTSFIRCKIFYTPTILVIMVFRDYNSNIFNSFKIFFESKTWNCVLYGEFFWRKKGVLTVLARSENRKSGPLLL